jgi:hypothetical protein
MIFQDVEGLRNVGVDKRTQRYSSLRRRGKKRTNQLFLHSKRQVDILFDLAST